MENTIHNNTPATFSNKNKILSIVAYFLMFIFGGFIVWSILVRDWISLSINFSFFLGCVGEILLLGNENTTRKLIGNYLIILSIILIIAALILKVIL